MEKTLNNSIVALITPFKENLEIDFNAFTNLIDFHLQEGTSGIVVSGTTGESATLSTSEKLQLLEVAVNYIKKKKSNIPIIFNSGTNNTKESIELSKEAIKIGADWIMLVAPYYNKPTQEGIYKHFESIAKEINKTPICLYNVPSRTSVDINVNTIVKLSKIGNIKAIKDATPLLNRPLEISLEVKKDFIQLSGEDITALSYLANGGKGCISVSANVVPKLCAEVFNLWNQGNIKEALNKHLNLVNLHKIMFIETNPAPAKYALSLLNKCCPFVRQPMIEISEVSKKEIKEVLSSLNLV